MSILLDTNILLRASDRGHSMYAVATESLMRLNDDGEDCVLVPQNLGDTAFFKNGQRIRAATFR